MRGALCFAASRVTSSYSREKQQIARPLSIATLSGRHRLGEEGNFICLLSRGSNSAGHFAEADATIITFTPARDREDVTIFQPFSRLPGRQFEGIRPPPCQLEHAAPRFFCWTADGTAGEQITGLEVAAADSVMGYLLGYAPVEVLKIGSRDDLRFTHRISSQMGLQMDVEG